MTIAQKDVGAARANLSLLIEQIQKSKDKEKKREERKTKRREKEFVASCPGASGASEASRMDRCTPGSARPTVPSRLKPDEQNKQFRKRGKNKLDSISRRERNHSDQLQEERDR